MPSRLPHLWDLMVPSIKRFTERIGKTLLQKDFEEVNQLVFSLQVLEIIAPSVAQPLLPQILECLPYLCVLLAHPYKSVRHMSARSIAVLASLDIDTVNLNFEIIIDGIIVSFGTYLYSKLFFLFRQ